MVLCDSLGQVRFFAGSMFTLGKKINGRTGMESSPATASVADSVNTASGDILGTRNCVCQMLPLHFAPRFCVFSPKNKATLDKVSNGSSKITVLFQ